MAYEAAASRALVPFGLGGGDLSLVSISENVTFKVTAGRPQESYVLRLHRPGYHSIDELDSERVWLAALEAAGISVPHPLPAEDGRFYLPVEIPAADEIRYAGLSRWVDGEVVGELSDVSRYFSQLGSLMATMHDQASAWTPPPTFRRHNLDVGGLLGDAPFWGPFWEHPELTAAERQLLISTRDRFRPALARYGCRPQTFSMIHADLHLANLLVDGDNLSVIDFDDAGFGWHQYDMAVALFDSRDRSGLADNEQAFLDAYRSIRPMTDTDLGLLPMFELIRGMALIGWKHQRPEVKWPTRRFDEHKARVLDLCTTFETPD